MSHPTLAEVARDTAALFETRKRDDDSAYVSLKSDAPDWAQELVFAAHGDGAMLPDDWRYQTTRSALHFIADADAEDRDAAEDLSHEFADQNVDVYTGARLAWLASHLRRPGYCDEARDEFGGEGHDIVEQIGLGQYAESQEVYSAVVGALADRLETLEEEADERAEL